MAVITLKEPEGPYAAIIETKAMVLELREVFVGVRFITKEGNTLSVCMRDDGYELMYNGKPFELKGS